MIVITNLLLTQISATQTLDTSNLKEQQSIKTIKNIRIKKVSFTCANQIMGRDGYADMMFTDNFVDFNYGAYFWSPTQVDGKVQICTININEARIIGTPINTSIAPHISALVRCIKNY